MYINTCIKEELKLFAYMFIHSFKFLTEHSFACSYTDSVPPEHKSACQCVHIFGSSLNASLHVHNARTGECTPHFFFIVLSEKEKTGKHL